MALLYELTAPMSVMSDVTLLAVHVGGVVVTSVLVAGAPLVPTSEDSNDGLRRRATTKGLLLRVPKRSAM